MSRVSGKVGEEQSRASQLEHATQSVQQTLGDPTVQSHSGGLAGTREHASARSQFPGPAAATADLGITLGEPLVEPQCREERGGGVCVPGCEGRMEGESMSPLKGPGLTLF